MQHWYSLSCSVDPMVKIHGNWCGPNWTGGQKVAAEDYKGPWDGPVTSGLDACCAAHDKSCSSGSCTRAADTRLIKCAETRILSQREASIMEFKTMNPFTSPSKRKELQKRLDESSDAVLVATGIEIARLFRRT